MGWQLHLVVLEVFSILYSIILWFCDSMKNGIGPAVEAREGIKQFCQQQEGGNQPFWTSAVTFSFLIWSLALLFLRSWEAEEGL